MSVFFEVSDRSFDHVSSSVKCSSKSSLLFTTTFGSFWREYPWLQAVGKSARWLWPQLNTGGDFLNSYRHAVQSLQKQSHRTALQRSRDVMDVVSSIALEHKHKHCLKAVQLILQLNRR
jgi:hypothetical protein